MFVRKQHAWREWVTNGSAETQTTSLQKSPIDWLRSSWTRSWSVRVDGERHPRISCNCSDSTRLGQTGCGNLRDFS